MIFAYFFSVALHGIINKQKNENRATCFRFIFISRITSYNDIPLVRRIFRLLGCR